MLVPDRPGVLAEVTTAAGELGANIEDLSIFHSTEGGRGRLEVVIAGEAPANGLRRRLVELGYHVDQGLPG
jgi:acetolactate synthase small subunit